jgi:hypothetical protein
MFTSSSMGAIGEADILGSRRFFNYVSELFDSYESARDEKSYPNKYLITNNYSFLMLKLIAEISDMEISSLFTSTVSEIGHCFSADVIINLAEREIREGRISDAQILLPTGNFTGGLLQGYWR